MALSSAIVWQCQPTATAANANGGGFKAGAAGTDYSKQDTAQYALSSLTSAGAGAIILTASASADMVGNVLHVISGTNFLVGWYEITAVSAGVSITTDRNSTSGVGALGVANVGGAISLGSSTANQTDANWSGAVVAGNTVHFNGTMTLAAALSLASTVVINGSLTVTNNSGTRHLGPEKMG